MTEPRDRSVEHSIGLSPDSPAGEPPRELLTGDGSRSSRQRTRSPRWASRLFYAYLAVSIVVINAFPLGHESLKLRPIDVVGAGCWIFFLTVPPANSVRGPKLWTQAVIVGGTVLVIYMVNGVLWYDDELLVELGQRCLRLFLMLGPFAAASKVTLTKRHAERLLLLMVAATAAGVYWSVVAYRASNPSVFAHQTLAAGYRRVPRLGGLVGETGAFSLYFFVAAVLVVFVGVRYRRLLPSLAVAVPMWAMALDGAAARISILMIVPLCLLVSNHVIRWNWARMVVPCLGASLLVLTVILSDTLAQSPAVDRILTTGQNGFSVTSGRSENWSELIGQLVKNPIFGRGYRSSEFTVGPSENIVIQGLIEFGLIGSAVLILAVRRIVKTSVQAVEQRSSTEALVVKGLLWGVLVQWLVNDVSTYYQAFGLVILFLVIAPQLADVAPERPDQTTVAKPRAVRVERLAPDLAIVTPRLTTRGL